jgi:peptidoglycan/LPS O-acetylase OafA/YrhL
MRHIKSLTSLRFFAAALIVFDHATTVAYGQALDLGVYQGVTFFFVLSGFILTYTYPTVSTWPDVRGFWLARLARIWPATMASMICVLLLIPGELGMYSSLDGVTKIAVTAMGMQAWIPTDAWQFAVNGVLWSISAETFFYLCFPALNTDLDRTWMWKLALCFGFVLAMSFIVWTFRLPTYAATGYDTAAGELIYSFPLTRLFEFMLGMAAASLWRRGYFQINSRLATAAEVALVGAIAAQMFVGPYWYEWGSPLRFLFSNGFVLWLERSGSAPLYALLIVLFAQERGFLSKALRHPLLVLGGEISFALYLTHQIVLKMMTPYLHDFNAAIFWGSYSIVAVIVAYLLWASVEKPCRRWLLRQHKPASVLAAA